MTNLAKEITIKIEGRTEKELKKAFNTALEKLINDNNYRGTGKTNYHYYSIKTINSQPIRFN